MGYITLDISSEPSCAAKIISYIQSFEALCPWVQLKVSKSQKKKYGVLDSSKRRTELTILSTEGVQGSEFRSLFGRIQDATICFRDLLTRKTFPDVMILKEVEQISEIT